MMSPLSSLTAAEPCSHPYRHLARNAAATQQRNRMFRARSLIVAFAVTILVGCAQHQQLPPPAAVPTPPSDASPEYVLSPGDQLEIKFFRNPELNQALPIRPDGRIALQLVGTLQAGGRTVVELKKVLDEAYAKELRDPDATVIVASFDQEEVYVGGEVKNPAVMQLKAGMTVRQAIFKSGGDLPTAQMGNVLLLRDQGSAQPRVYSLDLASGLSGGENPNDLVLEAKDVVYVPPTIIAEVDKFVDQYMGQIVPRWFQLSYTFGMFRTK